MSSTKSKSAIEERPNLAGGSHASRLPDNQITPPEMPGEPHAKMRALRVTRTYLEMRAPSELHPARSKDPLIKIEWQRNCSIDLFRFLYREVGRNYFWIDRLPWTDEHIKTYLQQPEVSLWLMTCDGDIAGYFELKKEADGSTEIAYFGLMPQFIGRGLGKHLLTCAVEQAWADGAMRVWLHTCTDDGPAALPNYVKRGFKPFKTEEYTVER